MRETYLSLYAFNHRGLSTVDCGLYLENRNLAA